MRPGTKDRAYQRMFTLLGMPGKVDTPEMWESIGKYGLGTKRSLEQYQQFIGVNLSTLEVIKILKKEAQSRYLLCSWRGRREQVIHTSVVGLSLQARSSGGAGSRGCPGGGNI